MSPRTVIDGARRFKISACVTWLGAPSEVLAVEVAPPSSSFEAGALTPKSVLILEIYFLLVLFVVGLLDKRPSSRPNATKCSIAFDSRSMLGRWPNSSCKSGLISGSK